MRVDLAGIGGSALTDTSIAVPERGAAETAGVSERRGCFRVPRVLRVPRALSGTAGATGIRRESIPTCRRGTR